MAETPTPFRKPAWAQIRPSRFRWNLVPWLIDTRRIRISNPLENSSSRKSEKIASWSCKIHSTSSTRPILTKRTMAEKEQEALYKPCKRHDPVPAISWASRCHATQLNWCRRKVYVAVLAVLQREKARDVIVRGPYLYYIIPLYPADLGSSRSPPCMWLLVLFRDQRPFHKFPYFPP